MNKLINKQQQQQHIIIVQVKKKRGQHKGTSFNKILSTHVYSFFKLLFADMSSFSTHFRWHVPCFMVRKQEMSSLDTR